MQLIVSGVGLFLFMSGESEAGGFGAASGEMGLLFQRAECEGEAVDFLVHLAFFRSRN